MRSELEKLRPREEASTFWVPQVTGKVWVYLTKYPAPFYPTDMP